jgi:hypothetical protein
MDLVGSDLSRTEDTEEGWDGTCGTRYVLSPFGVDRFGSRDQGMP